MGFEFQLVHWNVLPSVLLEGPTGPSKVFEYPLEVMTGE